MKIRIQGREGELAERAEDVVRVLEKIAGRSLTKAGLDDHEPGPPPPPPAALQGALASSGAHADRIRKVMDRKIVAVLARVK